MKLSVMLGLLLALGTTGHAKAANLAVITTPPVLLSSAIFIVAVGCLILCIQVLGSLKGGLLSKSWQMFLVGFALLAVSQIVLVLHAIEVVAIPPYVVPAVLTAMSAVFLYGLVVTRRTLG